MVDGGSRLKVTMILAENRRRLKPSFKATTTTAMITMARLCLLSGVNSARPPEA